MNIRDILLRLSSAESAQAAAQALQQGERGGLTNNRPLHERFASLITDSIETNHIPLLLRAVKRVHEVANTEEKKVLDEKISKFFSQQFKLDAVKSFQSTLEDFSGSSQEAVLPDLMVLFQRENSKDNLRKKILEIITKLPQDERVLVLNSIASFIKKFEDDKIRFINALSDIPKSEVTSLLSLVAPYLNESNTLFQSSGDRVIVILRALSLFPEKERSSLLDTIKSALLPLWGDDSQQAFLSTIKNTPSEDRRAILPHIALLIQKLTTNINDTSFIPAVMSAIDQIPESERVSLLSNALPVIGTKRKDYAKIIEDLTKIPVTERASILAHPFIKENESTVRDSIETLRKIPERERSSVLESIVPMTSEIQSPDSRAAIINASIGIPVEERSSLLPKIVSICVELSKQVPDLTITLIEEAQATEIYPLLSLVLTLSKKIRWEALIKKRICDIPASERLSVLSLAAPFCQEITDEIELNSIIHTIVEIPAGERESVVSFATPLLVNRTDRNSIITILCATKRLPAAERESVLSCIAPLVVNIKDCDSIVTMLSTTAQIPVEERASLLAAVTPLIQNEREENKCVMLFRMLALFPAANGKMAISSVLDFFTKIENLPEKPDYFDAVLTTLSLLPRKQRMAALLYLLERVPESSFQFDPFSMELFFIGQFLSLSCMADRPTNELLAVSKTLNMIPKQLVEKVSSEEALNRPELTAVSLEPLFSRFNAIWNNNQQIVLIDPFRNHLHRLLDRIAKREIYAGVPYYSEERERWYQNLHNTLAAILLKVIEKEKSGTLDSNKFESEFIKFARAILLYGTAWRSGAEIFYQAMTDRSEAVKNSGFEKRAQLWLNQYKESVKKNRPMNSLEIFSYLASRATQEKEEIPLHWHLLLEELNTLAERASQAELPAVEQSEGGKKRGAEVETSTLHEETLKHKQPKTES